MQDENDTRPAAARRLQQAREAAGIESARAAALRFGWSEHTYAQHENGTRGIVRGARDYARAFRVSEAWLLTGEGEPPGSNANAQAQLQAILADLQSDAERAEFLSMAKVLALGVAARRGDGT